MGKRLYHHVKRLCITLMPAFSHKLNKVKVKERPESQGFRSSQCLGSLAHHMHSLVIPTLSLFGMFSLCYSCHQKEY